MSHEELLSLKTSQSRVSIGSIGLPCHASLGLSYLSLVPQHHMHVDLQWDYYPVWLSYSCINVYAPMLQHWRAVMWGWLSLNFGQS